MIKFIFDFIIFINQLCGHAKTLYNIKIVIQMAVFSCYKILVFTQNIIKMLQKNVFFVSCFEAG